MSIINREFDPASGTPPRQTVGQRWEFFAPFFAPSLLAAIAITQLLFSYHRSAFSTWNGGGFGMFSTLDSPDNRLLRIHLVTEHSEIPVRLPQNEARRSEELSATDAESLAKALARTLVRTVGRSR